MKVLPGELGLKVGPLVLEVLAKHWFDRLRKDYRAEEGSDLDPGAKLKEDDVLYRQVFVIVKSFLNASTCHTIEEMQEFANTRTPSPPWVHVFRTVVPLSSCDDAATYLIKALGGEDVARRVVGGVKWWQVRGVNGVDAEWLTMKNDWREAKKRHKMQQNKARIGVASPTALPSNLEQGSRTDSNNAYDKDMDAMRCILYLHGGGYYFGSVDQTRYSTQRHAKKINGRVFAINYRLAPQYPFPCGLHDALAAYLFLIRPPPGSDHVAINPAHIIISGDSAGGGLSLALLQVIRDAGLPQPAGGVLISPWCDLSHSFPSIHQNTKSDVIPDTGLSFHKPSILWPPPSGDVSKDVHASLRFRIRQALRLDDSAHITKTSTIKFESEVSNSSALFDSPSQSAEPSATKSPIGDVTELPGQLHFYTVNSLIKHPLVSPITGFLGGLPPLLFITGDDEVLRDEIIYTAHKAAYPEKYPVVPSSHLLCPHLKDIEKQHKKPTSVHLQVYDGAPHILPVLFQFTIPAKFCFRAIASFDRFMTDMKMTPPIPSPGSSLLRRKSLFTSVLPRTEPNESIVPILDNVLVASPPSRIASEADLSIFTESTNGQSSFRQVLSSRVTQAGTFLRRQQTLLSQKSREGSLLIQSEQSHGKQVSNSSSGAGSRAGTQTIEKSSERMAGEPRVYEEIKDRFNWECRMIRERVSTSGIIRPLEAEDELTACKMPHERVAQLTEESIQRYIKDKQIFDQQFEHTIKVIEKDRKRNLAKAKEDTIKRVTVLQNSISKNGTEGAREDGKNSFCPQRKDSRRRPNFDHLVLSSPGWAWSWVLDELENPPPSSIVARRDTEEARQLAGIADWAIRDEDHTMSCNNLWNVIQNFLTSGPANGNLLPKLYRNENGTSMKGHAKSQGTR